MSKLYVFYEKNLVGKLAKNSDATLSFEYDQEWTSLNGALALSPALDLKHSGPFNNRESLAFFENLIPEGDVLINDIPYYITERYDREITPTGIKRLHQVDLF